MVQEVDITHLGSYHSTPHEAWSESGAGVFLAASLFTCLETGDDCQLEL